jgi:hypothetical protein
MFHVTGIKGDTITTENKSLNRHKEMCQGQVLRCGQMNTYSISDHLRGFANYFYPFCQKKNRSMRICGNLLIPRCFWQQVLDQRRFMRLRAAATATEVADTTRMGAL